MKKYKKFKVLIAILAVLSILITVPGVTDLMGGALLAYSYGESIEPAGGGGHLDEPGEPAENEDSNEGGYPDEGEEPEADGESGEIGYPDEGEETKEDEDSDEDDEDEELYGLPINTMASISEFNGSNAAELIEEALRDAPVTHERLQGSGGTYRIRVVNLNDLFTYLGLPSVVELERAITLYRGGEGTWVNHEALFIYAINPITFQAPSSRHFTSLDPIDSRRHGFNVSLSGSIILDGMSGVNGQIGAGGIMVGRGGNGAFNSGTDNSGGVVINSGGVVINRPSLVPSAHRSGITLRNIRAPRTGEQVQAGQPAGLFGTVFDSAIFSHGTIALHQGTRFENVGGSGIATQGSTVSGNNLLPGHQITVNVGASSTLPNVFRSLEGGLMLAGNPININGITVGEPPHNVYIRHFWETAQQSLPGKGSNQLNLAATGTGRNGDRYISQRMSGQPVTSAVGEARTEFSPTAPEGRTNLRAVEYAVVPANAPDSYTTAWPGTGFTNINQGPRGWEFTMPARDVIIHVYWFTDEAPPAHTPHNVYIRHFWNTPNMAVGKPSGILNTAASENQRYVTGRAAGLSVTVNETTTNFIPSTPSGRTNLRAVRWEAETGYAPPSPTYPAFPNNPSIDRNWAFTMPNHDVFINVFWETDPTGGGGSGGSGGNGSGNGSDNGSDNGDDDDNDDNGYDNGDDDDNDDNGYDNGDDDDELPPVNSGGNDGPPTATVEGNELVPGENGTWIELDDTGVPLGTWTWDDEEEEWIFEELPVPLGAAMPQTGIANNTFILIALIGLSLSIAAAALFFIMRDRRKNIIKQ